MGMENKGVYEYTCPVTLSGGGMTYRLKSDPIIAVSRANEIVKRSVAKPKNDGSIKESWAVGDWKVVIGGVIIAETKEELKEHVKFLVKMSALRQSLDVTCNVLNDLYDIISVAIEDLQMPATPGMLNQEFIISAVSDKSFELLEEL